MLDSLLPLQLGKSTIHIQDYWSMTIPVITSILTLQLTSLTLWYLRFCLARLLASPGRIFSSDLDWEMFNNHNIGYNVRGKVDRCDPPPVTVLCCWRESTVKIIIKKNIWMMSMLIVIFLPLWMNRTILLWHSFSQYTLLCQISLFNFKLRKLEWWFFIRHNDISYISPSSQSDGLTSPLVFHCR